MVTFAQAQERADEWVNGDVPAYQHREVRVREFELGFVVWSEDRPEGPVSDGGRQRLVIARDSGEATLWPGLPVGEVIRRYEEEYGARGTAPAAPEPPRRIDLNQTSFLLTPPEWLQEAADKLGIPDRRAESEPEGAPPVPGGASSGGTGGAPSGGVPAQGAARPEPSDAAASGTAASGTGASSGGWPAAGGEEDHEPTASDGVPAGATPWAGTDTNAGSDEGEVGLPATVFAPPLSGSDDDDTPPPGVSAEAPTALMSGGSQLPRTAVVPGLDPQSGPGTPSPGAPAAPGAPTGPASSGTSGSSAADIADAATSKATVSPRGARGTGPTTPPPPGAPGTPGGAVPPPGAPGAPGGYVPTQLVAQTGPPGGTPAPGASTPPGPPPAPGATPPPGPPGPSGPPGPPGATPPPGGGVHHAATVFADASLGGPNMPRPPGPPGAPGATPPPGPPAPPGATPPGGGVHHAATVFADASLGGPNMPRPPGPPGAPAGPHTPPPPAYGYPQQPAGQPTVGPGYQAVLRFRAPDGSEQRLIRRSAPGTPHPEWQMLHELRAMNVPPQQVIELHTELESCELPGAYCARMIREMWPQVRITSVAPYGTDHASRQQGMRALLTHQGELHQVADGPARPAPVRVPLPQVAPAPPLPPEALAEEMLGAFGPQGVLRFDQRAVSRQGVPESVARTLVWAGLPADFGPFFWGQPGQPVVPTLGELAAQRQVRAASDAGSYLVMGSDFGRAVCVQYGTANIVAVPVEAGPGGQPVPPQFVNTGLAEFVRSMALLGRMWRLRYGLNPEQAGRWTVDFQAQLAALDPAALASPESWWSVLLEQMWDGLL